MSWSRAPCLILLAAVSVHAAAPDGCPASTWTAACMGTATCQSLATAGLTCHSIAGITGCNTACATPCCIPTTTTTSTFTHSFTSTITVTETIVTHTITATQTSTETSTETVTTATATTSYTNTTTETTTGKTATHSTTYTATATGTDTSTAYIDHEDQLETTTEEESETTATTAEEDSETTDEDTTTTTVQDSGSTTSTTVPSVVIRLSMQVEVNDAGLYTRDSRVAEAYEQAFAEASGLNESMIAVEMLEGDSYITVTFVLTVPATKDGETLLPLISMEYVQARINAVDPSALNSIVDKKVDAALGPGVYDQKVLDFSGEKIDGADVVDFAAAGSTLTAAAALVALTSLLG